MSTEEKIKQAFDKQASRAGDHRWVLGEVRRRTSSRWRARPMRIALLTAGVAAAVVTPVVLFTGGAAEPVSVQPAAPPPAEVVPPGTPVLKYVPGWLPDEMVEDLREVLADGSLVRGWSVPGTGTGQENGGGQEITLTYAKSDMKLRNPAVLGAQSVDINGNRGQVSGSDAGQGQGIVEWLVGNEGKLELRVDRVPGARELALSIARSVRADSDAAFVRTIAFGWLPGGLSPGSYSVRGTSTPYIIAETTYDEGFKGVYRVVAQISPDKPVADIPGTGDAVTVRGKQGVFNASGDKDTGEILVQLKPGQWLKVTGALGKDDLVKVVDRLTLMDDPRFAWLGR